MTASDQSLSRKRCHGRIHIPSFVRLASRSLHATLAVNGEGIPLGVPWIQFDAGDGESEQGQPLEERTTFGWMLRLRECAALAAELDGVRPGVGNGPGGGRVRGVRRAEATGDGGPAGAGEA